MATDVTDRQALDLRTRLTIQFEFGTICDDIERFVQSGKIDRDTAELIKRTVRNCGNSAIRVIGNHLDYYNVNRNHRKDEPNIQRVARKAAQP